MSEWFGEEECFIVRIGFAKTGNAPLSALPCAENQFKLSMKTVREKPLDSMNGQRSQGGRQSFDRAQNMDFGQGSSVDGCPWKRQ